MGMFFSWFRSHTPGVRALEDRDNAFAASSDTQGADCSEKRSRFQTAKVRSNELFSFSHFVHLHTATWEAGAPTVERELFSLPAPEMTLTPQIIPCNHQLLQFVITCKHLFRVIDFWGTL